MNTVKNHIESLNKIIKEEKNNYIACAELAELEIQLGNFENVIDNYSKAIVRRGFHRQTLEPFATVFDENNRSSSIKELYKNAQKEQDGKNYDNALDIYKNIIKANKLESLAYLNIARIYANLDKHQETIDICSDLINLNLEDLNTFYAYSIRSLSYQRLNDYEMSILDKKRAEAETSFEKVSIEYNKLLEKLKE